MNRAVAAIVLMTWMAGAACDRPKAPPPPSAAETTSQPAEQRPTTQELLTGTFKKMPLPGAPLSLSVPQSWKIEPVGAITFLTGPTPSDQARIQVSSDGQSVFKPEQIDMVMERGKKEAKDNPDRVKRFRAREVGSLKVLERLVYSRPISSPKVDGQGIGILDEKGNIATITTVPVQWTITIFIPNGQLFNRYELNFIDLTEDQYKADEALLERIIGSLSYEAALANPGA